jgi:hypothetical protein
MIRENLNPGVDIEGILPTLVDSRTIHAKEAIEILEENFGDRVFASRIRKTVRFAEAPVKGMSVLKYEPDGVAAQSYRNSRRRFSDQWPTLNERACAKGRWRRCSVRPMKRRGGARRPIGDRPVRVGASTRERATPHPGLSASTETRVPSSGDEPGPYQRRRSACAMRSPRRFPRT